MPGQSGIHVGKHLQEYNPLIKIFIVTSYPDYLDEAMRFRVFRYLSKPIDKNRLFRNLKDAVYQYNIETQEIPVETKDGLFMLHSHEIVCVESVQRKTFIQSVRESFQTLENIEYWRSVLTMPCFYSPYRSFIVNMRYVHAIGKDTIELRYGTQKKTAYLAKRRRADFKDTYMLYLGSTK